MSQEKEVALFVTCLVDQMMPEVGVSSVKLLRRAGYTVTFTAEQTCCGQPFFNSGFQDEARRLARRTIDLFAEETAVVLPSGSCTTMIRQEYPLSLKMNQNITIAPCGWLKKHTNWVNSSSKSQIGGRNCWQVTRKQNPSLTTIPATCAACWA
ncbi:MAG: (Fe-S)-binding protein [Chloroflexi bacterium]|nr:(Fe-S)-binding protein [Chloroflexota bacterium]